MAGAMETFPDWKTLQIFKNRTPEHMHPDATPLAVHLPGWLPNKRCEAILAAGMQERPYQFSSCGATTREFSRDNLGALDPVLDLIEVYNDWFFNYNLDSGGVAWLQTYEQGDIYDKHTDSAYGQVRKLTAVVLLSEADAYVGGDLILQDEALNQTFTVDRQRGSVVIFQASTQHWVTRVSSGLRQSLNLGVYGPRWK